MTQPQTVDRDSFDRLASAGGRDLVSLFVPTHRYGRQVAQDRIRFKNQLSIVDARLGDLGCGPRERATRLGPVEELNDDREFWEHQDHGLAVYVDEEGGWSAYSLPNSPREDNLVLGVYQVRPILPALEQAEMPVLVLTGEEASVFAVSSDQARELDVQLPSFAEVNWFVDREPQRQQHPGRAGTDRSRHGHDPEDRADEDLTRYLREVDLTLPSFDVPLIVLGTEKVTARFTSSTDREVLTPDGGGRVSTKSPADISEFAGPVATAFQEEGRAAAYAEAEEMYGAGRGTVDLDEAIVAASTGRISRLFVDVEAEPVWGRLDAVSLEVDRSDTARPGDVDLLDRLAVWAGQTGASVSPRPEGGTHTLLAVFRY